MHRLIALAIGLVLGVAPVAGAEDWKIVLPEGAVGFKFGAMVVPGLTSIGAQSRFDEKTAGFVATDGLVQGGQTWPDGFCGSYVAGVKEMEFRAAVPNGKYLACIYAGKIIKPDLKDRRYSLAINEVSLCDEKPTDEEFAGDKYLYRFMWTQFSLRPHALWEDFIDKMYPSETTTIEVKDGMVSVKSLNFFLSALVLVPAAQNGAMDALLADIKTRRIAQFESTVREPALVAPVKQASDGDYLVFVPDTGDSLMPDTSPSPEERKSTTIDAAGAPGQRVMMKLAVTPFTDLGKCSLVLADLKGPGVIGTASIQGFYKNFRYDGSGKLDAASSTTPLVPTLTLNVEKGITQSFWLWMTVPTDAKAGVYSGVFTFKPEKGITTDVPVKFEVYPFKLIENVPLSLGMWETGYDLPFLSPEDLRKVRKERLQSMREIGFTAITVPDPAIKTFTDKTVVMSLDPTWFELAKEAGMGRTADQALLAPNTWAAAGRTLVRKYPIGSAEFKACLGDLCRQYKEYIDKMGLPVVVNSVDEPREARLNGWNRNLADTLVITDIIKASGLVTSVNPMADVNYNNVSYASILDHVDVLSTHAWKRSEKFMEDTVKENKTLWLYNCGQDRYTWGFYNWRVKSKARWEWAYESGKEQAVGGYPGAESFNPFTGEIGFATSAPYAIYKGGVLYNQNAYAMAEGTNDSAYIFTLEEALKKPDFAKSAKGKEAAEFLASLERAMPFLPDIKGLGSAADGPNVGMGANDEARMHVDEWRRKIAGYLADAGK